MAAEALIKQLEEGGTPKLSAYQDTAGIWTIGFGSIYNYDQSRPVQQGDTITEEQAYRYMRTELQEKKKYLDQYVTVPITKNQETALISLMYNIGVGAFKSSTLLRLLNAGADKQTVADQFDRWVYSGGVYTQGLANRRAIEKQLFLS